MNNYQAAQYRGNEWGVFSLDTRNWMVFGTEAQMKKRAANLNQQVMMANELRSLGEAVAELRA